MEDKVSIMHSTLRIRPCIRNAYFLACLAVATQFDSRMINMGARKVFVPFILRLLVSVHFVSELYDKIVNFDSWQVVIQKNTQFGEWALYLVIALLAVGNTLFLTNTYLYASAFCLLLFQVPTTIMFETTNYERFYSFSAVGGVCAIAWFQAEVNMILNMKAELERLSDMNIGYNKM